jgi:UDP-perosamine 4-acetyltransferase
VKAPAWIILGGGGHARVIIDLAQTMQMPLSSGILDADASRHGQLLDGVTILGGDELLADFPVRGITHFAMGVGGSGDNRPRQRLFEFALSHRLQPLTLIHPRATVAGNAVLEAGVQVLAGAIINAGAVIGRNVIVNSGAIVEHDCQVEEHVHVATGARLCGGVHVGARAHVGAGSTTRQGVRIGADSIIAAGAVVIQDVAPATVVAGVPAVLLRPSQTRES